MQALLNRFGDVTGGSVVLQAATKAKKADVAKPLEAKVDPNKDRRSIELCVSAK